MGDKTYFRPLTANARIGVQKIFNHYAAFSFAAYPGRDLNLDEIDQLLSHCADYPSIAIYDDTEHVIGFGLLRPYSSYETFASTALITYFIAPAHTRKGLGAALLEVLEHQASEHGITTLLAHVSSRNEGSLKFHRNHGFCECGVFHDIGCKQDKRFDVVWFEKRLG